MLTHVNFNHINNIEARYKVRLRLSVKLSEVLLLRTLTCDLSYIASILFANVNFKADTHEGFCSWSMLQAHFEPVSTQEGAQFAPGACSQIFNRLNIVEHFAFWKFCSRG